MRLVLIRHGETDWNAERRFQGQTDRPLSDRGRQQAEAAARAVAPAAPAAIYSSDLVRARATAEIVAASMGLSVATEHALRECSFGAWEGLTFDEIRSRYPQEHARWLADPNLSPPGGESVAQLGERMVQAVARLQLAHAEDAVAIVSHGGSLQALLCRTLGVSPRAYWPFRLEPGSISELLLDPMGAVLCRLNDTHHLADLDRDAAGRPG